MFRPIAAIFRLLQFCSKIIIYMPIFQGDVEISSSLRVYMLLVEQNFTNMKMAAIGRNMWLFFFFAIKHHHKSILP